MFNVMLNVSCAPPDSISFGQNSHCDSDAECDKIKTKTAAATSGQVTTFKGVKHTL